MKSEFKKAFDKHRSGRNCYIYKIRQALSLDRATFDNELKKLIVNQTVQTIGGDPSIMDADQVKDSYQDSNNNLHIALRWIDQEQTPEQVQPPTDFLMDNLDAIKEISRKYSTHAERWEAINQRLPEIEKVMSLNTFKQQVPIILAVIQKMDNIPQVEQVHADPPEKFKGWNVHQDKKGFIRLIKRVDGKRLKSLYIGKYWNEQKANEKVEQVMSKI